MDPRELRQKRHKLIEENKALVERAEKENRAFTDEEKAEYDKRFKDIHELWERIERCEQVQEQEKDLEQSVNDPAARPEARASATPATDPPGPRATPEYRAAFRRYLGGGLGNLSEPEQRALQAGSDVEGGYLVAPETFVRELIKAIDDEVFMRQISRVLPPLTEGLSLGAPALDTDVSDADWTTELATGTEDTALRFGKRELKPQPLAKRIKLSLKLIRAAAMDIEQIVRDRLAYKFGVTLEKAYMTGNGVNQPLGVYTATAQGISTARDISAGNTATEPTFDGLKNAKYFLKGGYWRRANWIFHRDVIKVIAKIKDLEGRYLWEDSVRAGEPDRIAGFPVRMSEFSPNTLTTGLYVGILGDFQFYWIVDALNMQLQRLVELYAETNQVGFIGRQETDAMPVLEEAFVRVKLA